MSISQETLRRIRETPQQWADDVHAGLLRLLDRPNYPPGRPDGRVQVLRSWTAVEEGRPVLYLVYKDRGQVSIRGLRCDLDEVDTYPLDIPVEGYDPAEDLASDLLTSYLEESSGTVIKSMAPHERRAWQEKAASEDG